MINRFSLFGFVALSAAQASAATTQPTAGFYIVDSEITAATASNGATCLPVGTSGNLIFFYPGAAKKGASSRQVLLGYNSEGAIAVSAFPVTPAAGATAWSGKYVFSIPLNTYTFNGTFTLQFDFSDTQSFAATITQTDPGNNVTGYCTYVSNWQAIRTGS